MDTGVLNAALVAALAAMIVVAYELRAALQPPACSECSHCTAATAERARRQHELQVECARQHRLDVEDDDRRV